MTMTSADSPKPKPKSRFGTLIRIVITIVGLGLAFAQVDFAEVGRALQGVDWGWLAVAFVLVNGGLVVRAVRWLQLLRGLGSTIGLGRLVSLYFIGNFFNGFLPTSFGGDVVRVIEVAKDVPAGAAAGTVIIDRLTGLMMLFVMALLALPFRPDNFTPSLLQFILAVSVVGLVGGLVLLQGSLPRRFTHLLPNKVAKPINEVLEAIQACGWLAVGRALLVSVGFNLLLAGWWWASGRALAFSIPFPYYLLVTPILSISLLIPSIGGLGPREAVAPLLFATVGLSEAEAVTLSLLVFFLQRISGFVGAIPYAWSSRVAQ